MNPLRHAYKEIARECFLRQSAEGCHNFLLIMISNANVAKQISDLMLDLFRRVDESVAMVREMCTPEEAAAYQKAAGRVAGPIVMDVLEPLYDKHPALKPHNWDD